MPLTRTVIQSSEKRASSSTTDESRFLVFVTFVLSEKLESHVTFVESEHLEKVSWGLSHSPGELKFINDIYAAIFVQLSMTAVVQFQPPAPSVWGWSCLELAVVAGWCCLLWTCCSCCISACTLLYNPRRTRGESKMADGINSRRATQIGGENLGPPKNVEYK